MDIIILGIDCSEANERTIHECSVIDVETILV